MKRLKAKEAKRMSDKTYNYPVISYDQVEKLIREATKQGKTWVTIEGVNLTKKTYRMLKWDGYEVYDYRSSANILDFKGHWFITWTKW